MQFAWLILFTTNKAINQSRPFTHHFSISRPSSTVDYTKSYGWEGTCWEPEPADCGGCYGYGGQWSVTVDLRSVVRHLITVIAIHNHCRERRARRPTRTRAWRASRYCIDRWTTVLWATVTWGLRWISEYEGWTSHVREEQYCRFDFGSLNTALYYTASRTRRRTVGQGLR